MDRRRFLLATSAITLTGCSELNNITGGNGNKSKELGESVSHRGVKVTPDAWITSRSVRYDIEDTNHIMSKEAPQGATFLLTHLSVKHVGEQERAFPNRGSMNPGGDPIRVSYDGEKMDIPQEGDLTKSFIIEDTNLTSYVFKIRNNNLNQAVYDGSVSGWVVNEIPEGFSVSDAEISIEWGAASVIGGDESNLERYRWTYTEDTEVTPSEAAEL